MNSLNTQMIKFWRIVSFLSLALLLLASHGMRAQNTENEQVKRLQRTIFIYNFAQQVGWPANSESDVFRIGVLGPDRTASDLQVMSQQRRISNKQIEVTRFQKVKDIANIDLLYVNSKYNFDIEYILSKISGENVLLISEDYRYNSSMINMVNIGDSFEYEINESLLKNENFVLAPSLAENAISTAEKWKELYRLAEKSRIQEISKQEIQKKTIQNKKSELDKKQQQIENQKVALDVSEDLILKQKDTIDVLWLQNELQNKKYQDKVLIERELERNIEEQLVFIKSQEQDIANSADIIQEQQEVLSELNDSIKERDEILKEQNTIIESQKLNNILLLVIAGLIFLAGIIIFRSYLSKKRLNRELEEKNKAIEQQATELIFKNNDLEQFAYIASHDLQEPLNTITSLIELLRMDYKDSLDETANDTLTYIHESSVRMRELINALLKHSRLGLMNDLSEVDCNKLIEEIKLDLKEVIKESALTLTTQQLPTVFASKVELRLVFQNLISNAVKFKKPNVAPVVNISVKKISGEKDSTKEMWLFSVQDNGIGIAEQYQERIFSIFQRLHAREEYEGTGIGLAHVKKIIDCHNGRIWLTSEEGQGSTFYFTIPA
tara:strand:+ start:99784 stop:101610 length:1827 start_codon:yes stop_codon:yes gene_type:complete